jgi:hypothetical protein
MNSIRHRLLPDLSVIQHVDNSYPSGNVANRCREPPVKINARWYRTVVGTAWQPLQ